MYLHSVDDDNKMMSVQKKNKYKIFEIEYLFIWVSTLFMHNHIVMLYIVCELLTFYLTMQPSCLFHTLSSVSHSLESYMYTHNEMSQKLCQSVYSYMYKCTAIDLRVSRLKMPFLSVTIHYHHAVMQQILSPYRSYIYVNTSAGQQFNDIRSSMFSCPMQCTL